MNQIFIIADDLTGAADTGVQFCPYYTDTVLTSYLRLSENFATRTDGAVALYTNSRALDPKAANHRLRSIARQLPGKKSAWIYKKIDSCLRGNPGVETEAILDELTYDASFIAPAFPEMGRTTVNGTHLVHGVPLEQTEISRDPITPVTESNLLSVIQNQCRHPIGHISLNFLGGKETALQDEIDRQIRGGIRHIVFDATCRAHLSRIARQIDSSSHRILPVGSAGLAAGFGDLFPSSPVEQTHGDRYAKDGNYLLVCGTNSEVTRQQINTLIAVHPYEEIALDLDVLIKAQRSDDRLDWVSLVRSKLSTKHVIITIDASQKSPDAAQQLIPIERAQSMIEGLGRFLSAVMAATRPGLLFLTGGDTADAVTTSAGAKGIRIFGEIVTGVIWGMLIGGPLDGLPVVTKAGAFGRDDTLVILHETLLEAG